MKTYRMIFILLSLMTLAMSSAPLNEITVQKNIAVLNFPEGITFELQANSSSPITSVQLEFGTDALSCGESVSRAIPEDYEPDSEISVEWVWNLRRSGSVPPGTEVWWRWVLENEAGETIETPVQTLIYLDDFISWRTKETEHLRLSWYEGTDQFADSLLDAGEDALFRLNDLTGVEVEKQVKIYIYASSEDMQEATLFAPDWSGGRAFPWNSAVIIGISPWNLEWGMDTMAHELSHVVIGHYTFSCVNSTPIWIDEGLAMVTEGDLESYQQEILQDAIESDTLLSVRELGQIFSADPDLARLSYAESFSLVTYLLETYGKDPMLQLLGRFQGGESEDPALLAVYGVDRDGLEVLWRAWLGAAPMQDSDDQDQDATPTATLFPTLAPIVGPSLQASQTPIPQEIESTPEQSLSTDQVISDDEPGDLRAGMIPVILIAIGGSFVLIFIVVMVIIQIRKRRGD
jgi:hypothetical protein